MGWAGSAGACVWPRNFPSDTVPPCPRARTSTPTAISALGPLQNPGVRAASRPHAHASSCHLPILPCILSGDLAGGHFLVHRTLQAGRKWTPALARAPQRQCPQPSAAQFCEQRCLFKVTVPLGSGGCVTAATQAGASVPSRAGHGKATDVRGETLA